MESFGKYWEATASLGNRGDQKVLSAGEAARTLEGDPMKFSAVLEFESTIDGIYINGIDLVSWNDEGKITDLSVR